MKRVITFRVPCGAKKAPPRRAVSDRSVTWSLLQNLHSETNQSGPPPSPKVQHVQDVFKRSRDLLLVLPEQPILPPFAYHSKVNGDPSYILQPRLSVTKLLTGSWCELREYYKVYAGLPSEPRTKRLKEGSAYHEKLETRDHVVVDTKLAASTIKKLAEVNSEELLRNPKAAEMGREWTERVVVRVLNLAEKSSSREILVHAFLDIESASLATSEEQLPNSVLVNGIVDLVQLKKTQDPAVKVEIEELEEAIQDLQNRTNALSIECSLDAPIWDLSKLLPFSMRALQVRAETHALHVGDVKTRNYDSIPAQELVLEAAELQCMYYSHFLTNLARDSNFAFASGLENARRRGVDPNDHIGLAHAALLLLGNFGALAQDFVRLAKGDPIGFKPYDEIEPSPATTYSLGVFVSEMQFRELLVQLHGEVAEFSAIDISSLFTPWKRPLTFLYFAARSAQAYNVLQPFQPATVGVEYHNSRTGHLIKSKQLPFSRKELDNAMEMSSLFWNGSRRPEQADDVGKCRYCDFKTHCPAINVPQKESIGSLIYDNLLGSEEPRKQDL